VARVIDLLRKHSVAVVLVEPPSIRDRDVTRDFVYARLQGTSETDEDRIFGDGARNLARREKGRAPAASG